VYEDLNAIAQLKFSKEIEDISAQTRQKVQDEKARFRIHRRPDRT
jgi:hypothetical protein